MFMLFFYLHGIVHAELLFKGAIEKTGLVIGLFICLFILTFAGIFSGLFVIIDFVLFLLKKPLIYPFEKRRFED